MERRSLSMADGRGARGRRGRASGGEHGGVEGRVESSGMTSRSQGCGAHDSARRWPIGRSEKGCVAVMQMFLRTRGVHESA
jgi:hypothetical protein